MAGSVPRVPPRRVGAGRMAAVADLMLGLGLVGIVVLVRGRRPWMPVVGLGLEVERGGMGARSLGLGLGLGLGRGGGVGVVREVQLAVRLVGVVGVYVEGGVGGHRRGRRGVLDRRGERGPGAVTADVVTPPGALGSVAVSPGAPGRGSVAVAASAPGRSIAASTPAVVVVRAPVAASILAVVMRTALRAGDPWW
jgi:hypothetical protein